MRPSTPVIAVAGLAVVGLAVAAPAAQARSATSGQHRTHLRGSSPSWVSRATRVAAAPDGQRLSLTLTLAGRNQDQAEALAAAVSTPGNAQYGHYLSTADYDARFAATDAQVAAVTSWLSSQGLKVTDVASNHRLVHATGTVAQAEATFATTIATYDKSGHARYAPVADASVPDDLASIVTGVSGLSTSRRLNKPAKLGVAPPPDAFVPGTPCSRFWGQKIATGTPKVDGVTRPYAPCGYTPAQLRGAYGVAPAVARGLNGRGVTVAITDAYAAPTIVRDANTYAVRHGGKPFAPGQFRQITSPSYDYGYEDTVNGDLCGENGWYGEETLDVEAVHGMAPGANILYVGARSCDDPDLLDALNTIVAGHKADIVTNSWGDYGDIDPVEQAALLRAYTETFVQAACEGIGMFFSSGDNGDEVDNIGTRAVDFPASHPWVTAVGGTSLGVSATNSYLFETGWGTSKSVLTDGAWDPAAPGDYVYGGGGGVSQVFSQPWYQRGVVPSSISNYFGTGKGRAVPDVAALGDPNTGFLVGETQTWPDGSEHYGEYRIGGTSLASPLMAGIEALADQAAGRPHGFANPAIYRSYGTAAFRDVVSPRSDKYVVRVDNANGVDPSDGTVVSLRALNTTGTLVVRRGYDDVTGVGSPNGAAYLFGLGRR